MSNFAGQQNFVTSPGADVGKSYAGILGVIAFNVAVLRGVLHGGSATSIMLNAWIGLVAFAAAGYLIGCVAEQIVNESIRANNEAKENARSKNAS